MTTATFYIRPHFSGAGFASATFYLPFRGVTGLYSNINAVPARTSRKKRWKLPKDDAWVVPGTGKPTADFALHWDYIVEKVLGGSNNKTLPEVENLVTTSQLDTVVASLRGEAQAAQLNAVAQALAAVRELLMAGAYPGATQIPPVPLQPAEVTAPYVPPADPGTSAGGGD